MRKIWLFAGFIAFASESAMAFDLKMATGKCTRLVVGGHDVSKRCTGKLINAIYTNGRSGFWFLLGKSDVVAFSGPLSGAIGDRTGAEVQPVDRIIMHRVGQDVDQPGIQAIGACRMTDPSAGKFSVTCKAISEGSRMFEARFVSDGGPPR